MESLLNRQAKMAKLDVVDDDVDADVVVVFVVIRTFQSDEIG